MINLRRLEEVSQNASRPERGVMVDGWSVGLSPSKAKRSRCVNAFYAGSRSFEENVATVRALYARAEFTCIFRMTPFVFDSQLDVKLDAAGFVRIDTTWVMAMSLDMLQPPINDDALVYKNEPDFIHATNALQTLRGDKDDERDALAARWQQLPLQIGSTFLLDNEQTPTAHAATIIDDGYVGLFDVVVDEALRNEGFGSALVYRVLVSAKAQGAHTAYLQVSEDNPARRLYERMGFEKAYEYWYRKLDDM